MSIVGKKFKRNKVKDLILNVSYFVPLLIYSKFRCMIYAKHLCFQQMLICFESLIRFRWEIFRLIFYGKKCLFQIQRVNIISKSKNRNITTERRYC